MTSKDDWFRNSRWDEEDRRAFEEHLRRARNKGSYLRIKALALAETRDAERLRAAIGLLERAMSTFPDSYVEGADHAQLAKCWEHLSDFDRALRHYRKALEVDDRANAIGSMAYVDFLLFVLRRARHLADDALRLVERHADRMRQGLVYEMFVLHAVRAILLHDRADAGRALQLARRTDSGLAKHPDLCLVRGMDDIVEAVAVIAAEEGARVPQPPATVAEEWALRLRAQLAEVMDPPSAYELFKGWCYPAAAYPILSRFLDSLPEDAAVEPLRFGIVVSLRDPTAHKVQGGVERLITAYERANSDTSRWNVAMALHPMLRKRHLAWLRTALARREHGYGREPLLSALWRLDREYALPAFLDIATEPRDAHPPLQVIRKLGRIGDASCVERLRTLLRHPFPAMGEAASQAIEQIESRLRRKEN